MLVIANIFGFISGLTYWVSNFKKTKKKMIRLHLVCNLFDFLQYVCTHSISGIIDVVVAFSKNLFYLSIKKERTRNILVYAISLIEICVLILVHENIFSLLKVPIKVTKVGVLCKGTVKYMLLINILDSVIWMLYDFNAGAYIAAVMGVGSVISILLGLIKNKGQLESRG